MSKPQPAARPPARDRLTNYVPNSYIMHAAVEVIGERWRNKRFSNPGRLKRFLKASLLPTQHRLKLTRPKNYSYRPANDRLKTPFKLARPERYPSAFSSVTAQTNLKPARLKSYFDLTVSSGVKTPSKPARPKSYSLLSEKTRTH